jgi:ankyrin repeat protein
MNQLKEVMELIELPYPDIKPDKYFGKDAASLPINDFFEMVKSDFKTLFISKTVKELLPANEINLKSLNTCLAGKKLTEFFRSGLLSHGEFRAPAGFRMKHFTPKPFTIPEVDVEKIYKELDITSKTKMETLMDYCLGIKRYDIAKAMRYCASFTPEDGKIDFLTDKLCHAAEDGDLECCRFLVGVGAKVDTEDFEYTPLYAAAKSGELEICKLLVQNGANINYQWDKYSTPLHEACELGQLEICIFLIESGANVNIKNQDGAYPITAAVQKGHHLVCEALVKAGSKVDMVDSNGMSLLSLAVIKGRIDCVSFLVKQPGIKLEEKDIAQQKTALHLCAERGKVPIAKILVEAGCNIRAKDFKGQTPLFLAAANSKVEMRRYLVSLGRSPTPSPLKTSIENPDSSGLMSPFSPTNFLSPT